MFFKLPMSLDWVGVCLGVLDGVFFGCCFVGGFFSLLLLVFFWIFVFFFLHK